ncbi:MAG: extracellular solute-binding protein [Actinomycetaceae bacterium]|nr:extracellular solute-binding protein [Actinomycetaceae bacterium]
MKGKFIAAVAASAMLLTACTGGGSGTSASKSEDGGTISFQTWSLKNEKFTPYFESLIKDFEKENPQIKVKWIDQPAEGYEDKVLQQAESGELPDVINLPPEYAYSLAKVGKLVDLKQESKVLGDYVEGGVGAYTYSDLKGSFGFPWYLGTELNYWNKDLLAKAGSSEIPQTYPQLWDASEKIAAQGVPTITALPTPKSLSIVLTSAGKEAPFYKDGKFVFNTADAVKVVERYAELYKKGAITPEAIQGAGAANNNVNNFNKGTATWTTAGPNYIDKDLAVNAPNLVPKVEVSSGFGTPPLFVQGISVSKDSKHVGAALKFAEFLTNTKNQIAFAKLAVGFYPGTKEANADPSKFAEKAVNPQQQQATELAAKQMDKAKQLGDPHFTEEMDKFGAQQIALAVKGEISAKEALDKTVEHANAGLKK